MKYYKDVNDKVFAYEADGSQDSIIPSEYISITPAAALALIDDSLVIPEVTEVSMRQARLALFDAGLLDSVTTIINSFDEPLRSEAQIEWEYATSVTKDSPLVDILTGFLDLSTVEIDDIFTAASLK